MTPKHTPETRRVTTPANFFAHPFSELKLEMDHLFDRFLSTRPSLDFTVPTREGFTTLETPLEGMMVPDVDIRETKKQITVRAELPGMAREDVSLTIQDGVLTLTGDKKVEKMDEKVQGRIMECRYGHFERSFTLPPSADQSKINAWFKDGVLTITMPKLVEKEWPTKRIEIK